MSWWGGGYIHKKFHLSFPDSCICDETVSSDMNTAYYIVSVSIDFLTKPPPPLAELYSQVGRD